MNNKDLIRKLGTVSGKLLKAKGYISFVDIFMELGYLNLKDYENWRMKKIPYLEKVIKINLNKINLIMKSVRKNSLNGKLKASWTHYKSWGKGTKKTLRFSKTGGENIEKLYSTHFMKSQNGY